MGGIVVLFMWTMAVLILGIISGWTAHSGFVLTSGLAFGALGLADDLLSIRKKHSTGLTARQKILLGSIIAVGLFIAFQSQILVPQAIPFKNHYAVLLS